MKEDFDAPVLALWEETQALRRRRSALKQTFGSGTVRDMFDRPAARELASGEARQRLIWTHSRMIFEKNDAVGTESQFLGIGFRLARTER